ncbi:MAG: hypothetical protein WBD73_09920, partial [Candidatus Acidiferrales bacterium]
AKLFATMGKHDAVDWTPELMGLILLRIADGASLRKTAQNLHISASSIIRQVQRDKIFAEQYARAKEIQLEQLADEILTIAEEKPMATITFGESGVKECVDAAAIQRNRLRVDSRKWLLSKLVPKVYGDKIQTEVSGELNLSLANSIAEARKRIK